MGMKKQSPAWLVWWEKLDHAVAIFEAALLVISLAGMVLMIFSQVILRNFFSTGVLWFDPLARHLMLVPVYVGASLATRHRHHVHMDALTKFFKGRNRHYLEIVISLFAMVVCFVLFKGAWRFVVSTYQGGDRLEGLFPTWIAQLMMPYGFFMMGVRFLKDTATHLYQMAAGLPPDQESGAHGMVMPGSETSAET